MVIKAIAAYLAANSDEIAAKVGEGIAWRLMKRGYSVIYPVVSPFFVLKSYSKRLGGQIRAMPFIYKDIELNAIDDFVDVDLETVDKKTLLPRKDFSGSRANNKGVVDKWWQIRDNGKVILMGEAGIGKTTIFRHLVLSILEADKKREVYPGSNGLVPIFVPLKAIDANGSSPIIRYLSETYEQFRGDHGGRLLEKLAKKRRLVFFLDGYDEIPYVGGTDLIKSELEALFADRGSNLSLTVNPAYADIYKFAIDCRVLLSTRREFFSSSRFEVGVNTRFIATKGIVNHRQTLVNKIFDRYRKSAPSAFGEALDEELFLQKLALSGNKEIAEISYNPLFLTALCFSYANQLLQDMDPQETWQKGTYELIKECLNLLIQGIDQSKTLDMPADKRKSLMNRRSIYPDQKMRFLAYLAGLSFGKRDTSFTYGMLCGLARDYFNINSSDSASRLILGGLDGDDPASNIIIQLINSGVFVSFPAPDTRYDFPHRRFREVLAVEYYNSSSGCEELASKCKERGLNSLILYYVQQTAYWGALTRSVCLSAIEDGPSSYSAGLLRDLLRRSPSDLDCRGVARYAIERLCVSRSTDGRALPVEITKCISQDDFAWLHDDIEAAIEREDAWAVAVLINPLFRINGAACVRLFNTYWKRNSVGSEFSLSMLYMSLRYAVSEAGDHGVAGAIADSLVVGDDDFKVSWIVHSFLRVISTIGDAKVVGLIVTSLKEKFPDSSDYLDESFDERAKKVRLEIMNAPVPRNHTPWE